MSPDPATHLAAIAAAGERAGRGLIASLARWPAGLDDDADVAAIRSEDIGDAWTRDAYEAICRLHTAGCRGPIDLATLHSEMMRSTRWDERQLAVDLAELLDRAEDVTGAYARRFAKELRAIAAIRTTLGVADDLARLAHTAAIDPDHPDQVLSDAAAVIAKLDDVPTDREPASVRHILPVAVEQMQRRRDQVQNRVLFGFDALDEIVTIERGQLLVLAARPSIGKTAKALAVSLHNAVGAGRPTLFVSLEMGREELTQRLLTMTSGIPASVFRAGRASPDDFERVDRAAAELASAPLVIDDRSGLRVGQIASAARRMKRRGGLALVIVDYLQLLTPNDRRANANRTEQVSQLSRDLKGLARELGVPVLALAQVNRACEDRPGGRPRLADLRESGSIEQDADVVILLSRRPDQAADAAEWTILADVAKQRSGPTGEIILSYHRSTMMFHNPDPMG